MSTEVINLYGIFVSVILIICSLYKINNGEIDFDKRELHLGVFIYFLVQVALDKGFFKYGETFVGFLFAIFIVWQIFRKDIMQAIISSIFLFSIMMFTEIILFLSLATILKITTSNSLNDYINILNNSLYISLTINLVFSSLLYLICSSRKIINIYVFINNFFVQKNFKRYSPLITSLFLFILFSFGVMFFDNSLVLKVSIFFFLFLFTIFVVFNNLQISSEYDKTKEKYEIKSKSLIEYEEMIDRYRINNHENKNQLQMIRNMFKQKDDSIDKYIDNLLNTVYMENENLMMDVSVIPAGGLRATIYSKLLTMENNNINKLLTVDRNLRKIDFFENNLNVTLKVCNLLNIFLDNAIDEVNLQEDKIINIDIFLEDKETVTFEITNKFITNFDIKQIWEKKYTTKCKGHGYGLTLAKDIIASEPCISNEANIKENLFTQILRINIK